MTSSSLEFSYFQCNSPDLCPLADTPNPTSGHMPESARASSSKDPAVDRVIANLLSSEWSRDKATSLVSRQLDREKKLPVACTTGPYDCAAGFDNTPA